MKGAFINLGFGKAPFINLSARLLPALRARCVTIHRVVIDTRQERRDMWAFKRYVLPPMYWHGMLKGHV